MVQDEEIRIRVKKEYLDRLRELGVSAQEVFSKGLEQTLRLRLQKYLSPDEFLDDFIEDDDEFDALAFPGDSFGKLMISDDDMENT